MSDRQAWLASLSEEEFERLQRVVQPPRYGRRDVLKAGGVAAGAAALGAGATGAAMGDASTSDSDGDIGQPGNRVDVFADGVDSDSVTTDEQNNNEVNLTNKVENGTFADILDAIANVDQVTSGGQRAVIEPGTYDVSAPVTLNWRNREIVAYGTGHRWDDQQPRQPVRLNWTGADGDVPLTVGDGNATDPTTEGVRIRGVSFESGSGTTATALKWGNGAGAVVRDVTFEDCRWKGFSGDVFVEDANVNAFANDFYRCRIGSAGTTRFPSQTAFVDGYLRANNTASPSFSFGNKSSVQRVIQDAGSAGAIGSELSTMCDFHARNAEGDGSAGSVAVVVSSTGFPVSVTGTFTNWDTSVRADNGAVLGMIQQGNVGTYVYDFQGGNNAHNGTVVVGHSPTGVNWANKTQNALYLPGRPGVSDIANTDVPPGAILFDYDRDGAGAESLLFGPTNQSVATRYINSDGLL